MKLLLDQNLSRILVPQLSDLFPESAHVRDFGLELCEDHVILKFAQERGFTLVLKECNLLEPGFRFGMPSKVVWLNVGNCSTRAVEGALRLYAERLFESHQAVAASLLVIG